MSKRIKNVNLIGNVLGVDFNKHKIKMPYKNLKKNQDKDLKKNLKKEEKEKLKEESKGDDKEKKVEEKTETITQESKGAEEGGIAERAEEAKSSKTLEISEESASSSCSPGTSSPKMFVKRSKLASLFSAGFCFCWPLYHYFRENLQKYFKIRNRHKGFSLIEVAIAIVVIGLVVGLSLKGKELIHTAKVNSVIDQVNAFRVATQMFTEKYGAIPGDFMDAKNSIDESLENGQGTGLISSLDDAKRFWSHLTKSGLLTAELVGGFPVSKLGGYYSVSTEANDNDGLWLVLTRGTSDNKSFLGVISQEDASVIDKKYDNGDPSSGDIRTKKVEGSSASTPSSLGKQYDPKNKAKNCVIMFKLW